MSFLLLLVIYSNQYLSKNEFLHYTCIAQTVIEFEACEEMNMRRKSASPACRGDWFDR